MEAVVLWHLDIGAGQKNLDVMPLYKYGTTSSSVSMASL